MVGISSLSLLLPLTAVSSALAFSGRHVHTTTSYGTPTTDTAFVRNSPSTSSSSPICLKAMLTEAELPSKIYFGKVDKETPKVMGGIQIGLRKLVVITGASSGLGRKCASTLAKTGKYFVVMACRDVEKGKTVAKEEKMPNNSYVVMKLELASFKSVRDFVANLKAFKSARPLSRKLLVHDRHRASDDEQRLDDVLTLAVIPSLRATDEHSRMLDAWVQSKEGRGRLSILTRRCLGSGSAAARSYLRDLWARRDHNSNKDSSGTGQHVRNLFVRDVDVIASCKLRKVFIYMLYVNIIYIVQTMVHFEER